ncbi:MAG: hypothetical protein GF317_04165 [Candidatus Lokiarchaeota archaeon]|jgi:hypothetical protein|nr:hypothetical protein [Candidatus Lokiarchaeota archaeon]MBD3199082.1 hypothetical protein [Candidatus Lokiarchaeota archaeon]
MCDNCIPLRNEEKDDIKENCGCGCLGVSHDADESMNDGNNVTNQIKPIKIEK